MIWIPSRGRFVGTQTEAKAEKVAFEVEDVPNVKADLIAYLNAREERHERELEELRTRVEPDQTSDDEEAAPDERVEKVAVRTAVETPAATREAMPLTNDDIVEQVMEMDKTPLVRVLGAAIARLAEIAGTHGWAAFAKDVYAWSPGARNVEQGLGMLMLAAFDSFGMDAKGPRRTVYAPITAPDDAVPN